MNARLLIVLLFLAMTELPLVAQPVATVGSSAINAQHLTRRVAIEQAYGGELTREAALVSLINDAIEREVARGLGLLPDSSELLRFSQYVDQSSKAPEILAAVKNIFGADSAEYRWQFLSPRIVNINLHQYFIRDTVIHATARRSIERAYGFVASGMGMSEVIERTGLRYQLDSVRDRRASLPPELARYADSAESEPDPYWELVSGMKPGELFKTIIETDSDYRIVRLVHKDDSLRVVQVIAAEKGDFDTWFRSLAGTIGIDIKDRALREEVVRNYPQLWWVAAGLQQ
jgi:hypothetical protein